MRHRLWTRAETLAAFNLYCRTPFGRLHAHNPEIIELAQKLGRTSNSVTMRCCNFASLDSALQLRGIRGLQSSSQLDRQIWAEFEQNPEAIAFEATQEFVGLMQMLAPIEDDFELEPVAGLEKSVVTKIRVNQRLFRTMILVGYAFHCTVCRLNIPSLLVASHVVPWAHYPMYRMNPRNGLCLCALHD